MNPGTSQQHPNLIKIRKSIIYLLLPGIGNIQKTFLKFPQYRDKETEDNIPDLY